VAQRVGRVAPGLYLVEKVTDKRIYKHYKLGPIEQYMVRHAIAFSRFFARGGPRDRIKSHLLAGILWTVASHMAGGRTT
jgi:hypothetical protein